ncbi:MAG TPA: enoyl-CoA hydratase/isomerase family protein [Burkholderiaceae bacterium]
MPDDAILIREIETPGGRRFGHATLNAPASLNALTLAMIDALAPQVERWAADPSIVGVVLDGAGEKAFCAGGDVAALTRAIKATAPGEVPSAAADFFEREYRLDHRLHTFGKPVLCWGHGFVMGGGIGLMAGASHRVVTERSRLAMPEIGIGLYPDVGGSWFLNRMPGRIGLFLALTGAPLNAADARFAGLADVIIAQSDKPLVLAALAGAEWSGDRAADAAQLSRLLAPFARAGDASASPLRRHLELIDTLIGADTLADIDRRLRASVEHADPWLAAAATSYAMGSPSSAAIAHEVLRRARHRSLAEVFRLEYQLSIGCCMHPDFAEGVRALLIDKDRKPQWSPATLAAVTPAWIDAHFAPRFAGAHPLADLR